MLPKAFDVTDSRADGDCLNVGDLTNDVKAHLRILAALANLSETLRAAQRGASAAGEACRLDARVSPHCASIEPGHRRGRLIQIPLRGPSLQRNRMA